MYTNFNSLARDMILYFMNSYFPDTKKLVTPIYPLNITHDLKAFATEVDGHDYKEGHRILNHHVRELGENPTSQVFMNIYATIKMLGTAF